MLTRKVQRSLVGSASAEPLTPGVEDCNVGNAPLGDHYLGAFGAVTWCSCWCLIKSLKSQLGEKDAADRGRLPPPG